MQTTTGIPIPAAHPEVPPRTTHRWQEILDLLAELLEVPAALVMRVHPEQIEVYRASSGEENPYRRGELARLDTGLYCETVMENNAPLHVANALEDPDWKDNPDVELDMINYLGFPLRWPDRTFFGTLCVLDKQTNHYNETHKQLLARFRDALESDLELLNAIHDLRRANNEVLALRELIPICASCKRVRDDTGYWRSVEHYFARKAGAEFTHGLCPDCETIFGND
jgi:GAF domain-containing protein